MAQSVPNTTAEELFLRLKQVLVTKEWSQEQAKRHLLQTIILVCRYGLHDTRHGFGSLSFQIDALCRRHNIPQEDCHAIQQARRNCVGIATTRGEAARRTDRPSDHSRENLGLDCRAVAVFISAVFSTCIPSYLSQLLPIVFRQAEHHRVDSRYVRCIVSSWDERVIRATDMDSGETIAVDYANTPEYIDLTYLNHILREGMQLNLLECEEADDGASVQGAEPAVKVLVPLLVVVEPDYLLDISLLASCFQDYGHHPFLYLLRRMTPPVNTPHTLLGNLAGSMLDALVHQRPTLPASEGRSSVDSSSLFSSSLRHNFQDKVLEYATCEGFHPQDFKKQARLQWANLQEIVREIFREHDQTKAILEPSFICEQIGLQGRVDLMTTDYRLLVEQKAGRNINIERGAAGNYGMHVETHYVQMLLYYAVLAYNFGITPKHISMQLLYSRYPLPSGLMEVAPLQMLLREAIRLRNLIVAGDYSIARDGFHTVIDQLTPATINERQLNSFFFNTYQLPAIERITAPIHSLDPLEKAYFCRMMTFVFKEQLLSKVGTPENNGCVADLWNLTLSEKMDSGRILPELVLASDDGENHVSDRLVSSLTFTIPELESDFLPDFRRGDMVYLYSYRRGEQPDVRRSFLFQATIQELMPSLVTLQLSNAQTPESLSAHLMPADPADIVFAVEHAASDTTTNVAVRSLYTFISSPQERRQLLLGLSRRQADTSLHLSRSYHPAYDDILLRAKQSQDYFLLIGPPGTGKTSMAIRFLVEEELSASASVLLMAYTNRAVDEICDMLCSAGINFLRIGNENSCAPRFKPWLLRHALGESPKLDHVRSKLASVPVVVGTTTALMSRPFIFQLRSFSLTIVDEASQILEPNLIGLLCSVGKFILVGDHKQLPAVVRQSEEESAVADASLRSIGLSDCRNSLFERLLSLNSSRSSSSSGVLHRQGRMHPDIAEWPSRMFYGRESLQPVPLPHQQEPSTAPRLVFIDVHSFLSSISSRNFSSPHSSDKASPAEAVVVARELARVYKECSAGFDPDRTVGIIVPYRNQISMIRHEIERLGLPQLLAVSIDTVERYQGSQRDVIIYSTTVSHRYQLDFLCSNTFFGDGMPVDRKLNVALTRARKQLIVIGDEPTLRHSPLYSSLIDHIMSQKASPHP